MYQLPLRFIKVSPEVSICATRIVAMMSMNAYQARRTVKEEKRAGTLINAAGRTKVKTAIFLDNGSVVASPFGLKALMNAVERSNIKGVRVTDGDRMRLKVYDVYDQEADPALESEDHLDMTIEARNANERNIIKSLEDGYEESMYDEDDDDNEEYIEEELDIEEGDEE